MSFVMLLITVLVYFKELATLLAVSRLILFNFNFAVLCKLFRIFVM
jgi:hypothetical protein